MRIKSRIIRFAGVAAPILFSFFVLLGGLINPNYSSFRQTVSTLIQKGAPNLLFLNIGIIVSNLFLSLFGYGIFRIGRNSGNKYKAISGLTLVAGGIAGVLIVLLPKDIDSVSSMTVTGYLHHVIAGLLTILALMSILFSEIGFHPRKFKVYSIISLVLMFIFAVTTVISGTSKVSFVGLFERITLFLYFQWLIVMSGLALQRSVSERSAQKIRDISRKIMNKTASRVPHRMKPFFAAAGIIAPLTYAGFVLLGGFLWHDYVPLSYTISTLVQDGAPNRIILRAGFILSNICLMLFGYGLFGISRNMKKKYRSRSGLSLIGAGIAGILIIAFPKDPQNLPTVTGFIHHFFIAVLAVLTIVSTMLFEFGENHNKKLRSYSKISLIFILGFGVITVIAGLSGYYFAGLFERLSIAAYLQWVLVIAIVFQKQSTKA